MKIQVYKFYLVAFSNSQKRNRLGNLYLKYIQLSFLHRIKENTEISPNFPVNCPKLWGNSVLPQNFYTRKLG